MEGQFKPSPKDMHHVAFSHTLGNLPPWARTALFFTLDASPPPTAGCSPPSR